MFLLLICFVSFIFKGQSQVATVYSKNTVYGNFGTFLLGGIISGNYERAFYQNKENRIVNDLAIGIGGGYWADWGNTGSSYLARLVAMKGKANHHIEFTVGTVLIYDRTSYKIELSNRSRFNEPTPKRSEFISVLPSSSAGYRFQKLDGGFVFRAGIGYPEGGYVGLGLSF